MSTTAPKPGSSGYIDAIDLGKAGLGVLFALLAEWNMEIARVLPDGTLVLKQKAGAE